MDACQGGSLQDLMDARGKALEEAEAALAMADIFAFLKACHENQVTQQALSCLRNIHLAARLACC